MRSVFLCMTLISSGIAAEASAYSKPCRYSFNKNQPGVLEVGPGFQLDYEAGEYGQREEWIDAGKRVEWVQTAESQYERKIVDGGVKQVKRRYAIKPETFYVKDRDGTIIGRFDSRSKLNDYVCNVLFRNYGTPKKS